MTRVKICCIGSLAEAELARDHGAHAIGLVGKMPSGVGTIDDERIRAIAAAVTGVRRFLLTSETEARAIVDHARLAGTDTVQIVDRVGTEVLARVRDGLPGLRIVPVVHVNGPEAIDEALALAPFADEILLDSGRPDAAMRTLGGTGRTHDWSLSARLVEAVPCPVFLAGGLGPDNVAAAIERVRPAGVDVCSRLRPEGSLDPARLAAFFAAVEGAAA